MNVQSNATYRTALLSVLRVIFLHAFVLVILPALAPSEVYARSGEYPETVRMDPPESKGIDDFSVLEDAAPTVISLFDVFDDPEDADADLAFSVVSNTNSGLVSTGSIGSDGQLTLTYIANVSGQATITVRATDTDGESTDEAFTVTVDPVNDAPSFNVGFSPSVSEDAGAQTYVNWATSISAGPNETGQTVNFIVSATNTSLFTVQPAVSSTGTLSFTPASNSSGVSTVTISLMDDGGTANGGVNESADKTFTITISGSNDPPTTTGIANVNVLEDAANTQINLYDAFDDVEDNDDQLTYAVTLNTDPSLFTSTSISSGILTLDYAADANGSSILTVQATDTGGLSTSATFTVVITPVNDEPTFTKGGNLVVNDNDPLLTFTNWATNISKGAANESFQNVTFSVTTPSTSLFSVQPTITSAGTLSFQPAQNASGTATLTVTLSDDGGTANGGDNTSAPQTFTITVSDNNSPPTTTGIANVQSNEDAAPVSINLFSSFADAEDSDSQLTYAIESVSNAALFVGGAPTIVSGTLTLSYAANAFGTSTVTVSATDTGGLSVQTTFTVTVAAVNDAPSFTVGPNVTVPEDSAPQNQLNWATNISAGPGNESTQTVSFVVTAANPALFAVQPAVSSTGILTFTPGADAFGSTTVTVTITDNGGTANGGTNTGTPATFTITLTPSNDPPEVNPDEYLLPEGESLIASAGGNPPGVLDNDVDVDGDVLTATILTEPSFAQSWSFNSNGSFFYLHDGSENLVDTFTYQVSDGTVTSNPVTATIRIIPENDPPIPGVIADIRLNEDAADVAIPLFEAFEDPDDADNTLTFSVTAVSNPALFNGLNNNAINAQTGVLTLDFLKDANGFSTVTVQATDPVGESAQVTFDVELLSVNDAPTMTIQETIDLEEDPGPQSITNWATNISTGPPDEANQTLSATITNNSNPALFASQPFFTINGTTGTLSFTPAAQVGGIAELTITLIDTGGLTNGGKNTTTYEFAIIIRGDNDRPTSTGIADLFVNEDSNVPTFNLFEIFDDVEDPDSLLTFTIESEVNDSLLKSVQISQMPAILEIDLQDDAFGSTSLIVRATDTEGLWAQEEFEINIASVNDAPTFTRGDNVVVDQSGPPQSISNWATDIEVGPENEQNQIPTFVVLSNNNEALFETLPAISPSGTLTFVPSSRPDAFGTATVIVSLFDNGGTENGGVDRSQSDTLLITLQRFNTPPTANNDNYIVDQGKSIQLDASLGVLANDSDPEGDPLTARVITPPVNGTLSLNPNGSFTYQHNNSLTTNDAFTYVANDGFDDSDLASVTISVQPLNTLFLQEIRVLEDSDSTVIDINRQLPLSVNTSYRYAITSVSNASLFARARVDSLSGVISLVYGANKFGFSSINITATPAEGEPINATQNVTVLPVNDAPIAVEDIAATIENTPVEVNVLNNDVDYDNDDLTIRSFSQPGNGTISPRSNGSFLYTPPVDFTGLVSFSYIVGDDSSASDEGLVKITVFAGQFSISELAIQENQVSAAYSVSNVGEVVGVTRAPDGMIKAFSSRQELPSATPSEASAANDFGQVVGALGVPTPGNPQVIRFIASRWDSSGVTALGALDNKTSKAFSINNEGRIVGTSTWNDASSLRGFVWESGSLKPLETAADRESQAFGINEAGLIAGYEGSSGIIWNGERILRRLPGEAGRAYDVNENGQATGSTDDGTVRAVFWDNRGGLTVLHPTESTFSEAYGINNSNWSVGTYLPAPAGKQSVSSESAIPRKAELTGLIKRSDSDKSSTGEQPSIQASTNRELRAFLWQGDQLVDLNNLIDPNSGWVLLEARSINNAAEITGIGLYNGEQRAFLLSPTINKAPTARNDVVQLTSLETTTIQVTLNDEDLNGDAIEVIQVTQGAQGQVKILDANTVSYTPDLHFSGSDVFTYTIVDSQGATAEADVTIEAGAIAIPAENYLSQNYPNPFNPTTTIQFGLKDRSQVTVELFNVLGQRVKTMIEGEYAPGSYEIQLDAHDLPGGVYIYRIQAGRYSDSKQLILLK